MSGKTSSSFSARSFYGESPPKRSRLQDTTCSNNKVNPAFKVLKDNLIKFDRKLSEPIGNSSAGILKGHQQLKKSTDQANNKRPESPTTSTLAPSPTAGSSPVAEPKDLPSPSSTTSAGNTSFDQKNLDRDSPLPLKNLGNTCYENSIIQSLFSLNTFMDNFEASMIHMRDLVVNPNKPNSNPTPEDGSLASLSDATSSTTSITISQNDVRFRIADAFDKLYKSYTKKRIQIESSSLMSQGDNCPKTSQITTNASTNNTDTASRESAEQAHPTKTALPLCKSHQQTVSSTQSSESNDVQTSNTPTATSAPSTTTVSNLTPIALVSPAATSNEQSEIEMRLEDLKSAVGERSSQFNSTHQQDASEFFYHVIDSIQEFYQSLNKNNDDDNPVTKAFELELDYLIKCPKCHHKIMSTEPEKIRTLPLALPHVNNESYKHDDYNNVTNGASTPSTSDSGFDSPKSHSSTDEHHQHHHRNGSDEKENQALVDEITPEDNNSNNTMSIAKLELTDKTEINHLKRYTLCDALNNYFKDDLLEYSCSQPGCDSKHRTKKCLIRKLPQILFITLARYSYTGKKNLDEIEAPFELSVPFWENKSPSHHPSTGHRNFSDDDEYQLVAVVCHLGSSLNAGHYTSYVFNRNNLSWYCCDDDSITKVQEDDVKNDARKTGYCFFYAHKSC